MSCGFISPSLWEGRPASGRGGVRAGSDARPSPRFARPSQGEGDDKRLGTQHFKTARPQRIWGGSESERSARIPGRVVRAVSQARPSPSRTPERRRSTSPQTSFRERCTMLVGRIWLRGGPCLRGGL
ncbi:MAG: hypothetical protein NXI28_24040 [bacterium]|nr:hypothetical protein [bacterium]